MALARIGALAAMVSAIAGCHPAHDASKVVKGDPSIVYAGFADAFSENAFGGASQYSELWHGGLQTDVERTSDSVLDVLTKFDGHTAVTAHLVFTPADGGKATLVEGDIDVDQAVVRKAFDGTPNERLGTAPKMAFAQGLQMLMTRYASHIETGTPLHGEGSFASGEPPPEFYDGMPEDLKAEARRHDEQERQEAAAAPMTDPNADAERYLHPTGSSD
jgi:hypothetical protein